MIKNLLKSLSGDDSDKIYADARKNLDQLAHDIRNPLARLRGWAEIALSDETDQDAWKSAIEAAFENSESIIKLLDLESEQLRFRFRKINKDDIKVEEILKEIVSHQQVAIDDKTIDLNIQIEPGLTVHAEKKSLVQSLNYIIDNAIKYNIDNGKVWVEAKPANQSGQVEFIIRDTGIGIPPSEIGTVFKRLFRGAEARKQEGYGVGLTYARDFALAHEGMIEIQSPAPNSVNGTEVRMVI